MGQRGPQNKSGKTYKVIKYDADCPTCRGNKKLYFRHRGNQIAKTCGTCKGSGKVQKQKTQLVR